MKLILNKKANLARIWPILILAKSRIIKATGRIKALKISNINNKPITKAIGAPLGTNKEGRVYNL